ncbi:MAG: hypothetical protein IPL61_23920 [Myxococcales bacterium]|nr:hypothetical protein [Myxococcales bacterium]
MQHLTATVLAAVTVLAPTATAAADVADADVAAAAPSLRADVEIDPTAYALAGHSLHVGLGAGHWRVDLGNFAMAMPAFAHDDDGFDVAFTGYGAKLQYFVGPTQRGWFAGVDAGLLEIEARRQGTDLAARQHQLAVGVNLGYRIGLPHDLYATPWLGVGYQLGADPITLGGGTYEPSALTVFPAIHLGYTIR